MCCITVVLSKSVNNSYRKINLLVQRLFLSILYSCMYSGKLTFSTPSTHKKSHVKCWREKKISGKCILQEKIHGKWMGWKNAYTLQLHADLSVYFRNGHNRWILYPEGSIYSSGLSLRECSFWLGSKKVRFYGGRLRSEFKGIEQWLN